MAKQQNVIVRHNSAHLVIGAQGRPSFDTIKAGGSRRVMLEVGTGKNKRRIVDPSPDILSSEPSTLDAYQTAVLADIKLRKQLDSAVRKAKTDMAPRFVRPDGSRVPSPAEKSAAVEAPKASPVRKCVNVLTPTKSHQAVANVVAQRATELAKRQAARKDKPSDDRAFAERLGRAAIDAGRVGLADLAHDYARQAAHWAARVLDAE